MEGTIRLRFSNSSASARELVLEPWGGRYMLEPLLTYDVVATGDLRLPLALELREDQLVLFALDSAGADLRIYQAGKELRSL